MASDSERPELAAFDDLQRLVGHLGDELATFRRRALSAESRLKTIESAGGPAKLTPQRAAALEQENVELKQKLETARNRTRQMLERVRFLRQQHEGTPS